MKIQEFIDELNPNTKRPETLRAYRRELERFHRFLKVEGSRIDQVKPSTIVAYVNYLHETHRRAGSRPLSTATINHRLSVLSRYFVWAQGHQRARGRCK